MRNGPRLEKSSLGNWLWYGGGRSAFLVKDGGGGGGWKGNSLTVASVSAGGLERSPVEEEGEAGPGKKSLHVGLELQCPQKRKALKCTDAGVRQMIHILTLLSSVTLEKPLSICK